MREITRDTARTSTEGTWLIGDLARLSGVTSRTLRHYDAIGLLAPRGAGPGGRRFYGRYELLRLQQILVLRELDVPLATVAEMLSSGTDPAGNDAALLAQLLEHLREHQERLLAERDRFDRLARTVAATITALTKGEDMAADRLYEGFDNSAYDAEARERWGDEPVDRSNAAWARLGPAGQAEHHRETAAIGTGLAAAMADGATPDDDRVQALVARHFAQIVVFWTPTAAAYAGLGQMYVDDERFTSTYDAFAPGLAVYLRDAMAVYARVNLS
ncbi:MerR family transcriptional regulator [Pengzhenrongella frigida]|uniref:MerR family transcriptional regulator n=1 Tax=Pengzhenrongella frigida TaxID=1259133 RepID=A0A4Q5N251_9MICO|nr:MerR family transcriptional regulator [Cellulomonas sp. HLT2-17]RYV50131.1 MerR family transcriptional regulator [Cellulomonas sp. HLT2-17]